MPDYAIFMLDPAGIVLTWNAGAERIKGYTRRRDHRPALLASSTRPSASTRGWPAARAGGARRERPLRGRGLARAQGRHALLGQRRHHRAARRRRPAASASPRSRATSPSGAGTKRRCARARSASACWWRACATTRSSCSIPTGNVASWNAGAAAASRATRADEIIGRHFSIFYPPEEIATGWPRTRAGDGAASTAASRTRAGACARTARASGPTW